MKIYHTSECFNNVVPGQAGTFYSVSELEIESNSVWSWLLSNVDSRKADAVVVESRLVVVDWEP